MFQYVNQLALYLPYTGHWIVPFRPVSEGDVDETGIRFSDRGRLLIYDRINPCVQDTQPPSDVDKLLDTGNKAERAHQRPINAGIN